MMAKLRMVNWCSTAGAGGDYRRRGAPQAEEFDIARWPFDGRLDHVVNVPRLGFRPPFEAIDHLRADGGVSDDAALAHLALAGFELRLDQGHEQVVDQREDWREGQLE